MSRGGLQFSVWRGGLPAAVFAEEGVEQAGEAAHAGDERDLVRLAVGGEALVAGRGGRLEAAGGEGGHVEQVAGLGSGRRGWRRPPRCWPESRSKGARPNKEAALAAAEGSRVRAWRRRDRQR